MQFKCCAKNSKEAENVSKVYDFLRVVSDPNRLKIMCALQAGPKCVCEIVPAVEISDKLASHHLKQLRKLGLLVEERAGNYVYYSINKKVLANCKALFNKIVN